MDDLFNQIKQTNDLRADKALAAKRHHDLQMDAIATQETILKAFKSLVAYLDNPQRITKTAVVNQLKAINTPDSLKVADAVRELHETVKTHRNTDLSEVTRLLNGVLEEAKRIPKNQIEVAIPDTVKVSNLPDHAKDFQNLLEAVKAIKLVAEAPKVVVPTPVVNVDAPDMSPVENNLKAVEKAVRAIVIPEYKTDNTEVEKQLKKANKTLAEILDKPVGGRGGSGGRATPYENASAIPEFVTLIDHAVPIASHPFTERYDYSDANVIYTATAPVGTAANATGWTITKYDLTTASAASGKIATDVSWDNRALGSYN